MTVVFWLGSVRPDAGDAPELGDGARGDERPGVIDGPGVASAVPSGEVDKDASGVQSDVPVEVGQVGGGVGVVVGADKAWVSALAPASMIGRSAVGAASGG